MRRRTLNATSNYRGGSRAASISAGGPVGRNGQFVSRRQREYDLRLALGVAGG